VSGPSSRAEIGAFEYYFDPQANPQSTIPLVERFLGARGHAHTLLATAERAARANDLPATLSAMRRLLQGTRQIGALRAERRVKELQTALEAEGVTAFTIEAREGIEALILHTGSVLSAHLDLQQVP